VVAAPALSQAATTAAASQAASQKKPEDEKPADARDDVDFIKGELNHLGMTRLEAYTNRFGVRAGVAQIGAIYNAALSAEFDLRVGKFMFGLALPINIPVYDPLNESKAFLPEGFNIRVADYGTPENALRVLRYFTVGRKEEKFFLNVGSNVTTSIGHASAVRRYVPNTDINQARVAAGLDMHIDYAGFEAFVGDVLHPEALMGGMAFVRPMHFSDNLLLKYLSVGATYAADFAAPYQLERASNGRQLLTTNDKGAMTLNSLPRVAEARAAQIMGLSIESKLVRSNWFDLKPYYEFSQLVGGGAGHSAGLLTRMSFGGKHAIRFVAEGRMFDGNYLPGYFDTFYSVQRYQYFIGRGDPINDKTKLEDVLSRDKGGKLGYYAELQYAIPDALALMVGWEDSNARGGTNLVAHAEVMGLGWLKGFASVHRRAIPKANPDAFISPVEPAMSLVNGGLNDDSTLFVAGARLALLPVLFVNARAYRMWQIEPQSQSYRNIDGVQLDLEVGFEIN